MSNAFTLYCDLLRRLHAIQQASGDCPEADAIADQMDEPWYAMSAAEQAEARLLSSRLNRGAREGSQK